MRSSRPVLIALISHCRSWFHCQKVFWTGLSKSRPAPRSWNTRPNWEKCEADTASQVTKHTHTHTRDSADSKETLSASESGCPCASAVCMCVLVGALWCAGACLGECAHEDAGSWLQVSSSIILYFIYQGRVFHLNPGLAASASLDSLLQGILFLLPARWSYRCVMLLPGIYKHWGSKLWSSRLCGKCSTWWVTSPACVNHKVHRSLQNNWDLNHLSWFLF